MRKWKFMEKLSCLLDYANIHIPNTGIDQHINLFLTMRLIFETIVPPPLSCDWNAACHTSAHVVLLDGLKRMNNILMSQCAPRRAFSCSSTKAIVVLLIQSCEYLPSAINNGRTNHSFHILGNLCFTSSKELTFEGNLINLVFPEANSLCWLYTLVYTAGLAHSPGTPENNSVGCRY